MHGDTVLKLYVSISGIYTYTTISHDAYLY